MTLSLRPSANFQQEAFDFIIPIEDFIDHVYGDSVGVPTIGYGYALVIKDGGVWKIKSTLSADLAALNITLTQSQTNTLNQIVTLLNQGNTQQAHDLSNSLGDQIGTGDIRTITPDEGRTLFNRELDRALQAIRSRFKLFLWNKGSESLKHADTAWSRVN